MPAGDLRGKQFIFEGLVYHFAPPPAKIEDVARKVFEGTGIPVRTSAKEAAPDGPRALVLSPKLSDLPPPSADTLQYSGRGLDNAAKKSLQKSAAITSIQVAGPASSAAKTYRAALIALFALEKAAPGAILDEETRETFSREAFAKRLDGWNGDILVIQKHVVIHIYRNGELMRAVSLGMRKFGLPDMVANQVAASDASAMSTLMTIAMQTLVEQPNVPRAGALDVDVKSLVSTSAKPAFEEQSAGGPGKGTLRIAIVKPEEGDADNRLIELVFPGPASALQQRHSMVLASILGRQETVVGARHDDAALLAASARAKVAVLAHKPKFAKGAPEVTTLLVRAPFDTSKGGIEWMWVEVTRWEGKKIDGLLKNDPFDVPALKAGARVTVEEGAIFDYIFRRSDGTVEGNETSSLLRDSPKVTK